MQRSYASAWSTFLAAKICICGLHLFKTLDIMATDTGTVTKVIDTSTSKRDAEKTHEVAVNVAGAYEVIHIFAPPRPLP